MKKVLIIQAARFGDLIQSARLIESLTVENEVHLCVDHSLAQLARIIYPQTIVRPLNFHSPLKDEAIKDIHELNELKTNEFAAIYNCNFSPLSGAVGRMFPEKELINYKPVKHSPGGLYRSPWVRIGSRLAGMRRITPLNLVDYWGHCAPEPVPGNSVNPDAKPGGGGLGIILSGREARRSLPAPSLSMIVQLANQIMKPERIIFFGTTEQARSGKALYRNLAKTVQAKVTDLCGKTDWQGLINNIKNLDLLLTPDTGSMHLAAKLGVPVMGFFLSSAWCHETGPYGIGHHVWQATIPCAPCLESEPCKNNLACLNPFSGKDFYRCFTELITQGHISSPMAQGLACYKTEFDPFGIRFKLLAGHDPAEKARHDARLILMDWLYILPADEEETGELSADALKLYADLFPDQEWMLPPERYY